MGRGVMLFAAVLIALAAPGGAAAGRAASGYISAEQMMAAFQENGITVGGRKQTVLDVVCEGVGYKRGAFPYEKYHIFSCYVTTSRMKFAQYRVTVSGSRYSYIRVP